MSYMPELPEVETVRCGLERLIVGKRVLSVDVLNAKSFEFIETSQQDLIGKRVIEIRRRGKVLIIDLEDGCSLVGHLKMTGQIVVRGQEEFAAGHPTDSFMSELPDRSTRIVFNLDGGAKLFFNDQRKFGWIKLMPTNHVKDVPFLAKMGPEPWDSQIERKFIKNIRHHQNSMIKPAILDQSVMAGIGNIYADESLWMAKVHPETRVKNLADKKLEEICLSAGKIMQKSIASGGSTMKNYVKADGTKGNYLEKFANVFRRDGLPCPRCETTIIKLKVAGRGTHVCPRCQKLK
jgi:formamidopyrimidine-DNA glycosylase